MKKHTTLKSKFNSAFSLVELLVVIAVIAVIAAIAIPNVANVVNQSQTETQRKNAQTLVNVYNQYVAAVQQQGGQAAVDNLPDASIAQALAVLGGTGTRVGTSQPFSVGGMAEADLLTAAVIVPTEAGVKTLGYDANP